jgi:hypothetical protein
MSVCVCVCVHEGEREREREREKKGDVRKVYTMVEGIERKSVYERYFDRVYSITGQVARCKVDAHVTA